MKNLTIAVTVLALLVSVYGVVHVALADTQCGDPHLSNATTTYIACGNGNPENIQGGWGTTNSEVPHLSQGQSATDDNGFATTCQWATGCVDVFHTDWYKNQMSSLRAQLGDSLFQMWVGMRK